MVVEGHCVIDVVKAIKEECVAVGFYISINTAS